MTEEIWSSNVNVKKTVNPFDASIDRFVSAYFSCIRVVFILLISLQF